MPLQTYLEAIGVVLLAIGCAVLGSVLKIEFLANTVPPALFGIAVGSFGQAVRLGVGK